MAMRSYLLSYAVAMGSLLAGAAFVHNIYRPDLVSATSILAEDGELFQNQVPAMLLARHVSF
jgi:hypothetical protein